MFVPVVDKNRNPLMPTTPARARKWVKSGKATPFFRNGVFCVRLNVEPSGTQTQDIAVGIDPDADGGLLQAASFEDRNKKTYKYKKNLDKGKDIRYT